MYKVKLSKEDLEQISYGNTTLLKSKLEEADRNIYADLKKAKGDTVATLQGYSACIDDILRIL